jgi:hypothetical protein
MYLSGDNLISNFPGQKNEFPPPFAKHCRPFSVQR